MIISTPVKLAQTMHNAQTVHSSCGRTDQKILDQRLRVFDILR